MLNKRLPSFLVSVLFSVILMPGAGLADNHADEQHVVKIGLVLPLSGDWAFLGNGVRDAVGLAKEDLQDSKFKFEFVFEDNGGQLKQSATAAYHLVNSEKVDVIISIISGVGLLINPIAEKAGVINIGLCSNVNVADGNLNFTNYITTSEGAEYYLNELLQKANGKAVRLGIFALNEEGFGQILEQVQLQSKEKPVDIVFVERFEPQTRDFRSQLSRAMRKEPETLLILGLSPEIETLVTQLRQLNLEVPLASIEAFGLAENKSVFDGAWYIDAAAASFDFEKRFEKSYGRSLTAAAAHAYDSVMIVAKAFENTESDKKKPMAIDVAKTIRRIKSFNGVVGDLVVDSNGVIHSTPSVKVIKNGVGVLEIKG